MYSPHLSIHPASLLQCTSDVGPVQHIAGDSDIVVTDGLTGPRRPGHSRPPVAGKLSPGAEMRADQAPGPWISHVM